MKIAICDNEIEFLDALSPLLEQWARNHGLSLTLRHFTDGYALIETHQKEYMDLIILDVIMPLISGLDIAREIRNSDQSVSIVFLTSSKEFAVDSYDVKALNYLIKPVDTVKLFQTLDDFLKIHTLTKAAFTAHTASGFFRIITDDVIYLEAQNKQVLIYLTNVRTITICEQLSKCEEIFSPENGFFRCHRSYIVNLSYVLQFTKTAVTTLYGMNIPISRNRYPSFKEAYFKHMSR